MFAKKFIPFFTFLLIYASAFAADPLPSWNDTPVKQAIIEYMERINTIGDDYIPVQERIATFDNDGTLWAEQPVVQLMYMSYAVKNMAKDNVSLLKDPAYKAVADGDLNAIMADREGVMRVIAAVFAGVSADSFEKDVKAFFDTARYPKPALALYGIRYQPQMELLAYLHKNGFKVYICSGGDVDFMRVISLKYYGIPEEHVIGARMKTEFDPVSNKIMRKAQFLTSNDESEKAVNIEAEIGRPPVFAVGNVRSGGDIYMLRYSQSSKYPNMQIMVDHDDAEREFAYTDNVSLPWASKYGFRVVSMKKDWKRIFTGETK